MVVQALDTFSPTCMVRIVSNTQTKVIDLHVTPTSVWWLENKKCTSWTLQYHILLYLLLPLECISVYHCLSLLVLSSGTCRPLSLWTARSGQQVPNHSHVTLPVYCWILSQRLTSSLFSQLYVTLTLQCVFVCARLCLSHALPALPLRACAPAFYQLMIHYFL